MGNPGNPIETAPKDGTRILVFVPNLYDNASISGWFTAEWLGSAWEIGYAGYMDEGASLGCPEPSCWLPLPNEPPSVVSVKDAKTRWGSLTTGGPVITYLEFESELGVWKPEFEEPIGMGLGFGELRGYRLHPRNSANQVG